MKLARGSAWVDATLYAITGDFALQVDETGRAWYPPRELVPGALAGKLAWVTVAPRGTILASTHLHVPGEPFSGEHGPWPIALVAHDAGARVIAHLLDPLEAGELVELSLRLDRTGRPAMCASELGKPGLDRGSRQPPRVGVAEEFLWGVSGADVRILGAGPHAKRIGDAALAAGARLLPTGSDGFELAWPLRVDFD
ncbi:Zn-ribbon domain-containing OB-fold protein [Leucobacter luti]|uniref:Acyl-CoA-associated DUF35 OB-fold domain-containing protein n=1 Tax=Leucobacter luti TaxID=340320 RepID=A0A4Q7U528_9MICO|nr:OB-fold domain-containing protein [Leucobacter luti]RZT68781.1 acyl-CoA-associated DUF35 OB-fold domain-containing protein [Leucobacter luti]